MRNTKTLRIATASAVAAVGAAAVIAAPWSSAEPGQPPAADPTSSAPVATTALTGTAESRLGILRRSSDDSDRPTAAVRRVIGRDPYDTDRSLRVAEAKAIPSDATGAPSWLVPGEGKLCLFVPDPIDGFGATCQSDDAAINGRLKTTLVGPSFPGGGSLTALVVPDGTESVTVTDADGRRDVLVNDNVAVFRLREGLAIEYRDQVGLRRDELERIPDQVR